MVIKGPVLNGIADVLQDEPATDITIILLMRAPVHFYETTSNKTSQCWSQRASNWGIVYVLRCETGVVKACALVVIDEALNLTLRKRKVILCSVLRNTLCLRWSRLHALLTSAKLALAGLFKAYQGTVGCHC